MQQLHDCLLSGKDWEPDHIVAWTCVVDELQSRWEADTEIKPFPKIHMLRHSIDFAERFNFLGRASESQIESFHAEFKRNLNLHQHNTTHDDVKRLTRTLADSTLRAVQTLLV
jgi:hypothetical protein